jgi:phosphotransferase system  glucose/maltose/N-acetylglucosamine-specific IIC component
MKKSWMPTVFGVGAAAGSVMAASGPSEYWKFAGQIISAACLAGLGITAKQYNVSGGKE